MGAFSERPQMPLRQVARDLVLDFAQAQKLKQRPNSASSRRANAVPR